MAKHIFSIFLFFITISAFGQTVYTVETIPNPKIANGFVSNPDNVLSASAVSTINSQLQALEDSTTVQVAVVVVNSIGSEVPGDFRTKLFRYWGIGQKEKNNGLLILLVINQRRVEFETGYGLEGILTDAMCKRIQVDFMVPLAKLEDYDGAVSAGVNEVVKILQDPIYRDEVMAYSAENFEYKPWWRLNTSNVALLTFGFLYGLIALGMFASRKKSLPKAPPYVKNNFNEKYLKSRFYLLNLGVPLVFIIWQELTGSLRIFELGIFVYAFSMIALLEKRFRLNKYIFNETADKSPQEKYNLLAKSHNNGWLAASIFFPLPFIFYALFNKKRLTDLRNIAPLSSDGKTPLIKLSEINDDKFLEAYQLIEESIKSIDYDVWKHPQTNEIKIFRYDNFRSKYDNCPNCKAKAFCMTKNETLVSATYESSGKGMKTYVCASCAFTKQTQYTIPKRVQSSSSSGSGGGGGGGSFGGGSSGGGGGGSSW